jgi:hypothetical protein
MKMRYLKQTVDLDAPLARPHQSFATGAIVPAVQNQATQTSLADYMQEHCN